MYYDVTHTHAAASAVCLVPIPSIHRTVYRTCLTIEYRGIVYGSANWLPDIGLAASFAQQDFATYVHSPDYTLLPSILNSSL